MPDAQEERRVSDTAEREVIGASTLRDQVRALVTSARSTYSKREREAFPEAVRAVCMGAAQNNLRAEHLIVLIKREWRAIPVSPLADEHDMNIVLESLITSAITEYYSRPAN